MLRRICWVGCAVVGVLWLGCSEEPDKKKVVYKEAVGGTGGGGSSSGGSSSGGSSSGGAATTSTGSGGTLAGAAGAGDTGGSGGSGGTDPATGGSDGSGGMSTVTSNSTGVGGAGGEAGAGQTDGGDTCPEGFGECDGDPDTVCEQSLNLVTSCGTCSQTCIGDHGVATCEDQACKINSCDAGYDSCDDQPENGCETAITTDTDCGSCGHDCTLMGSTCTSGLCGTVTIFGTGDMPFGSDNSANRSWAFDPASASAFRTGFNSYRVQQFPVDGSASSMVWEPVSPTTAGIESVAVTGGEVYWSVGGNPAVVLKKAIGADPTTNPTQAFFPRYRASYLRVQGNAFYWVSGDYQDPSPTPRFGYVYTRAISAASNDPGTAIVTEDQGNFGNFLAFQPTSDALYWVSNAAGTGIAYELRTTGLGGGTPSVVPAVAGASDGAVINGFATVSLFARGDTLYFNRDVDDSTINGVYRYQVGDTAPTQLVMAENVTSIMVDDTSIYLLQRNTSGVFKAPLTGGSAARIANLNALKFIGQDAQFLYLLTTTCCVSTLVKVLK